MSLRTARLVLRSWTPDDLDAFAELNADPEVMRWFPSTLTREQSDAAAERFVRQEVELGYTAWAVEVVDSSRGSASFVGFTGLVVPRWAPPFPHDEPCVEIGWRLARPWWGLGIAQEAARAALAYAFDDVGVGEVVSFTVAANIRSQAVMQAIGMRYDGVFEHPNAAGAWWGPHVLYRVGQQ